MLLIHLQMSTFDYPKQTRFVRLTTELYARNKWTHLFAAVRFWTGSYSEIERMVPKKGTILDLGCGYGIFANYLALASPSRKMIGIDTDRKKIKNACKGVLNTSFKVGDATKMKIKNLTAIILHDVLHHLNSYTQQEQLIKDCKNMLKRNGILIIVEVNNTPLWKLILGRATDFLMYKGQQVYYRYKKNMLKLLQNYFSRKFIYSENLQNSPYPHVVYICQKT